MGFLYALGAFFLIGSYLVPVRLATVRGLAFFPVMGMGLLLVDLFLWESLKNLWADPTWFWGSMFSGLLWAIGQGLGNMALEEISLAKAAVFFNFNSFVNIVVGLVMFHEAAGLRAFLLLFAGGLLLFLGAWWVARVTASPSKEGNLKRGLVLSLAAGLFWGVYFAPMRALQVWYPRPGLTPMDALSGMILGGALAALLTSIVPKSGRWTWRNGLLGSASAVLWILGTAGFLLAIQSLGLSRAVPIINSNTLVYAGWSLFVFKELPLREWKKISGGTFVVVVGVALMAFSK